MAQRTGKELTTQTVVSAFVVTPETFFFITNGYIKEGPRQ